VTDPDIDIFDREQVFIDRHLVPITRTFPELRVVLEHVTTLNGVQFVQDGSSSIGATITAHHLLYNRNAMLVGGIRPHFFCLPVLKRETHRRALLEAATGKNPRFFLGSDSAPHARNQKESACGCAGSYTAHAAIELYAEAFDSVGALSRLEAFASLNGPAFYGLLPNQEKIILERSSWTVEEAKKFGDQELVPLRAGQEVFWRAGNAG
jgi:dihydroorotase